MKGFRRSLGSVVSQMPPRTSVLCVAFLALLLSLGISTDPADAEATPLLNLTQTSGSVGSTLSATASGFTPGDVIQIAFSTASAASCVADASGSCTQTLTVPATPAGSYDVDATDASSGSQATAPFAVVPALSLTPSSGPEGTLVTGSVTGFEAGESVLVRDYVATPPFLDGNCTTDATGSCSVTFEVNWQYVRSQSVRAMGQTSGLIATASFVEGPLVPTLSLDPASGPSGSTVTAQLSSFSASDTVTVSIDGTIVGSCLTTGATGDCDATFAVPSLSLGNYDVSATDSSGATATADFIVVATTTAVTLSAPAGQAGSAVTATAVGFLPGESIDMSFDSSPVGSCTANPNGSCSVALTIPSESTGTYPVSASGTTSGLGATVTFVETGPLSLSLTPNSGSDGALFEAAAAGFEPGEGVTITSGPLTSASCSADAEGACSALIYAPSYVSPGPVVVTAVGSQSELEATATFVLTPTIGATPGIGQAGSQVTLSGAGFDPFETVEFSFDGTAVGSCVTDATGGCPNYVVMTVPPLPAGSYSVTAVDTSGFNATGVIRVVPSISLSSSTGPDGSPLTATPSGFEPGETVTLSYDSLGVASCITASDGACSITFVVPRNGSGNNTLTATGTTSGLEATATFLSAPTLTLSSTSGPPGTSIAATAEGFTPNDEIEIFFSNGNSVLGSCTTDSSGNCSTDVVVPEVSPGGEYYFSADNSSFSEGAHAPFDVVDTPSVPTVSNLPAGAVYGAGFVAAVSTNGDGSTSVTSSTPSVCSVTSGLDVSYVGVGTCTLTAQVSAGTNYCAASGSAQSFSVSPASYTVKVAGTQTYGSSSPSFAADPSSGPTGPFSGSLSCTTVDDGTAITSNLAADGAYSIDSSSCSGLSLTGSDATNYSLAYTGSTFSVAQATPSVPTVSNLPTGAVYGASFVAGVSTNGDGSTSVSSSTPSMCSVTSGLDVSYLGVGTCTLTAQVSAGTNYSAASGGTQSFSIGEDGTGVLVTASPSPAQSGEAVTFSAAITAASNGSGTPTGTPTWTISPQQGSALTCSFTSTQISGTTLESTCEVAAGTLTAESGPYTAYVAYPGDENFTGSSGNVGDTVVQSEVQLKLIGTISGGVGTFTAKVKPLAPGEGVPTGSVTFTIKSKTGTKFSCKSGNTVALSGTTPAKAECTVSSGLSASGIPYTVTVAYSGDGNFVEAKTKSLIS
jgi:large repetitive protein